FGAPVRRREDPRLLTGRGRYVSDVELPRVLHVAFVRSTHARARLRAIDVTAAAAHPGVVAVVTGQDARFPDVRIRARSALPDYVEPEQPILAWPAGRSAGAPREGAARGVGAAAEPPPAPIDALTATREGAPLVHDGVRRNAFLVRRFQQGDVDSALASSATVGERAFRTNRQCAARMEGRGGVAEWSALERKLTR